jgi:RNA polymerase sigma factor (sigma-70 family)
VTKDGRLAELIERYLENQLSLSEGLGLLAALRDSEAMREFCRVLLVHHHLYAIMNPEKGEKFWKTFAVRVHEVTREPGFRAELGKRISPSEASSMTPPQEMADPSSEEWTFAGEEMGGSGGVKEDSSPMKSRQTSPAERREALESLCKRYWKPIIFYMMRKWSKTAEDATDLAQAFFAYLKEGKALRHYSPDRVSFRTYLKAILRNFVADQHDPMTASRKAGTEKGNYIDEVPSVFLVDVDPATNSMNPEEILDWSWRKELLERAMVRTRQWFANRNRGPYVQVFEECVLQQGGDRPTFEQVAQKHGLRESDIATRVFAVRERLRSEIRAELSETVLDRKQLEKEWKALFGG